MNDIFDQFNSFDKCFASVVSEQKQPFVIPVKKHHIEENRIALYVSRNQIPHNNNGIIAITGWKGITGYQIKGKILNEAIPSLDADERSDLDLVIGRINEVFIVSPGKSAGYLIHPYQ